MLFPLNYTVMFLLAFSLWPKETSLFHLIWNFTNVLGQVNLLCCLSQDSGRVTILPLIEGIDPVSLSALRNVQRSGLKSLGTTAAPIQYGSDVLGVTRGCLTQTRQRSSWCTDPTNRTDLSRELLGVADSDRLLEAHCWAFGDFNTENAERG